MRAIFNSKMEEIPNLSRKEFALEVKIRKTEVYTTYCLEGGSWLNVTTDYWELLL